ncbi:unnamed protein product, partial [marine sediment metagenome]
MAQKVTRGTLKRFEVYITDLEGNPGDPDKCAVKLIKQGEYSYDSPKGPYTCSEIITDPPSGYWYADVALSSSMTLGNWIANFEWENEGVWDAAYFDFIVVDMVRPYI